MAELSEKDQLILDFIRDQLEQKGFPPSVREICDAVGLNSTATVHAHLKKLEKSGHIIRESSKNRSLRLADYTPSAAHFSADSYEDKYLEVPVIGKVTAGEPITAVQDLSDTFPLPMRFARNKDIFMLRVQGESMINAAILDGDYVIVQKQPTANNGDIVVALIDNENATVKTFYKENGHFRLQPENDTMEPIIVNELSIIGKVVGVFREL
jgi:repressor LexA